MAYVDTNPTYELQAATKVMSEMVIASVTDNTTLSLFASKVANPRVKSRELILDPRDENFWLGQRGNVLDVTNESMRDYWSRRPFATSSYQLGLSTFHRQDLAARVVVAENHRLFWHRLLTTCSIKQLYTDEAARHFFLLEAHDDPSMFREKKALRPDEWAAHAKNMWKFEAAHRKASYKPALRAHDRLILDLSADSYLAQAWHAAEATESLLLGAPNRGDRRLGTGPESATYKAIHDNPLDWYSVDDSAAGHHFDPKKVALYRIGDIWIIHMKLKETAYVMDRASIDQVRKRAWWKMGARWYAVNYRKNGNEGLPVGQFRKAFEEGEAWFYNVVRHQRDNQLSPRMLARAMKTGQARFVNDMDAAAEPTSFGHELRSAALRQDEIDVLNLLTPWSDFLKNLKIPERSRLDLSYLFHLAPGNDANIIDLYYDTISRLTDERKSDEATVEQFFKYVEDTVAMEYVYTEAKRGENAAKILAKFESDYDVAQSTWFKETMKGNRTMPADQLSGRAKMRKAFTYRKKADYWYLSAKDVTHVIANLREAIDIVNTPYDERIVKNELLYVLVYGPLLSRRWTPEEAREALCEGRKLGDTVAELAAKAENTKFGMKVRETYSGDDVFRELQSEMDHAAQNIANIIHGPSLRESSHATTRKMMQLAKHQYLDVTSDVRHVVSSQDVSSWSPRMSRKFAVRFYNLLLSYTDAPEGLSYTALWKVINVTMARRGVSLAGPTTTGNFMGYPGTADTVMHSLIGAFTVRKAKEAGIISESDAAEILVTIDDAVLCVSFKKDPKLHEHEQYKKVQPFMEFMCACYSRLGFEVDRVKTIVSAVTFTYLNRVFSCGSEVLTPMKIFAKMNRELESRLASTTDHIVNIFSGAYGAAERGADPVFAYLAACVLAARLVWMTTRGRFVQEGTDMIRAAISYAPRNIGGWGIPTILAWMTSETSDPMSEWFAVCHTYMQALSLGAAHIGLLRSNINSMKRLLNAVFIMSSAKSNEYAVVLAPRVLHFDDVPKPESVGGIAMLQKARELARSPTIVAALDMEQSDAYQRAVVNMAKSSKLDAAVYETLAANSPYAVVKALITKAQKNEVVVCLLSNREIVKLKRKVVKRDRAFLMFLPIAWRGQVRANIEQWDIWRPGAAVAHEMRERVHQQHGFRILNHTEPAIMDTLAHTPDAEQGATVISCLGIKIPYKGLDCQATLYDGTPAGKISIGLRTAGSVRFDTTVAKTADPLSRCIVKMASICAWLVQKAVDPTYLWQLFLKSWGIPFELVWTSLVKLPDDVANSSRLSDATARIEHPIAAFPNCQGSVVINVGTLGAIMMRGHYRIDYASVVQICRAQGLLERACVNKQFDSFKYGIRFVALMESEDDDQDLMVPPEAFDELADVPSMFDTMNSEFMDKLRAISHKMYEAVALSSEEEQEIALALTHEAALAATTMHRHRITATGALVYGAIVDAIELGDPVKLGIAISGFCGTSTADTTKTTAGVTVDDVVRKHAGEGLWTWGAIRSIFATVGSVLGVQKIKRVDLSRGSMTLAIAQEIVRDVFSENEVKKAVSTARSVAKRIRLPHLFAILSEIFTNKIAQCLLRGKNEYLYLTAAASIAYLRGETKHKGQYIAHAITRRRKPDVEATARDAEEAMKHANPLEKDWLTAAVKKHVYRAVAAAGPDTASEFVICRALEQGYASAVAEARQYANFTNVPPTLTFSSPTMNENAWRNYVREYNRKSSMKAGISQDLLNAAMRVFKKQQAALMARDGTGRPLRPGPPVPPVPRHDPDQEVEHFVDDLDDYFIAEEVTQEDDGALDDAAPRPPPTAATDEELLVGGVRVHDLRATALAIWSLTDHKLGKTEAEMVIWVTTEKAEVRQYVSDHYAEGVQTMFFADTVIIKANMLKNYATQSNADTAQRRR